MIAGHDQKKHRKCDCLFHIVFLFSNNQKAVFAISQAAFMYWEHKCVAKLCGATNPLATATAVGGISTSVRMMADNVTQAFSKAP